IKVGARDAGGRPARDAGSGSGCDSETPGRKMVIAASVSLIVYKVGRCCLMHPRSWGYRVAGKWPGRKIRPGAIRLVVAEQVGSAGCTFCGAASEEDAAH